MSCGTETRQLQNILIGDIWICSGQSNMEWPMRKEMHWRKEKDDALQPLIRLNNPPPAGRYVYGVAYTDSLNKRLTVNDFYQWHQWLNCDSSSLKDMSAVAYYFAKSIVENENVPVGLINLSIGGAPIETFISRSAMQQDQQFFKKVEGNWLENVHLPEWIRGRGKENVGKNTGAYGDGFGLNHAYKPGFAFESGIRPLLPLPVKGVIWYQGESNSLEKERVEEYRDLLHLLINDYRKQWRQTDMPFYWVQLSSIDTPGYKSGYWPEFRNEQRLLIDEVQNGGMAVCSDIGLKNNVHPTDKKTVGERLARWALSGTYKREIVPSGPLPLKARFQNGQVIVQFRYAAGLRTADGAPLRGFSIDGKTDITASIRNDIVTIDVAQKPEFVFYGWKPFTDANLSNAAILPASTFKIAVE
ncbi:MAG: sialate O-acetylesterase [Chitinophagaceae bacterium]